MRLLGCSSIFSVYQEKLPSTPVISCHFLSRDLLIQRVASPLILGLTIANGLDFMTTVLPQLIRTHQTQFPMVISAAPAFNARSNQLRQYSTGNYDQKSESTDEHSCHLQTTRRKMVTLEEPFVCLT